MSAHLDVWFESDADGCGCVPADVSERDGAVVFVRLLRF